VSRTLLHPVGREEEDVEITGRFMGGVLNMDF
jgi:hypothetical protein